MNNEKGFLLPPPASAVSSESSSVVVSGQSLNILYSLVNIASSILIIMSNKVVFTVYKFNYGSLLTLIHFIVTYLGLALAAKMNVFEPKKLEIFKVLPLSLAFCGFVVLTNLSLQHNSVGIYQIAKVLTTPCVLLIQFIYYGKSVSKSTLLAVLVTCIGVFIVTSSDVSVNIVGSFYAITGVLVTAIYQIWVGTMQKDLECNSMQLLLYQAPISSVILFILMPWLENLKTLQSYQMTSSAVAAILASAVLALAVNLSIFLIIGKMSAVTYNMIGHLKLCTVLLLGYIFFDDIPNAKSLFGISIALTGIVSYSFIRK